MSAAIVNVNNLERKQGDSAPTTTNHTTPAARRRDILGEYDVTDY